MDPTVAGMDALVAPRSYAPVTAEVLTPLVQVLNTPLPKPEDRGTSPAKIDAGVASFIGVMNASTAPAPDAGPLMETEEITATVGRCVSCVAQDFASCPVQLFDVTNRDKPVELFEHPFLDLMRHINPVWQPNLFWQHVIADLMVEGNSFNWLGVVGGVPYNLLRFRPQQMFATEHPTKIISGYVFVDELGVKHPYPAEEIMHIRTRNLGSPYRGLGEIVRLRQSILLEREIHNVQYHRFKKGLPVGLIIKSTRSFGSDDELERFSAHIQRTFGGSENAGRPMIFQKGEFEVDQIARPSEEEIGFLASLAFTRQEISMMFGVPPARLGIYSDVRANSDTEIRSYWEDTIAGWQRLVVEYVNSVILMRFWPKQKLEIRFDTSHVRALQSSAKEITEVNESSVRSAIMTPNEARERIGLEAYKDAAADKLYWNGQELGKDPLEGLLGLPGPGDKEEKEVAKKPERATIATVRAIPSRLLNEEEEIERLAKRVRAIIEEIYRIAGEQHSDLSQSPTGSIAFRITDPDVIRFIATQTINVSQGVVHTTVEMLRKAIAEQIHAGAPIPAMRDAIQEAFVARRADWQLDRIARTEVHQAQEAGGWLAAKQQGIEFKRWLTARDSNVRGTDPDDEHDHTSLEGQIVPMDAHFVDGRSRARLLFPGDSGAPVGATVNCRCTWVSDFSNLRAWNVPDFDHVWIRKAGTGARMELAMRRFFDRELAAMQDRALDAFDQQMAAVAA